MTQLNFEERRRRVRGGILGGSVVLGACVLAMAACSGSSMDGPEGSGGSTSSGGAGPGSGGAVSGAGGTGGTSPGTGGAGAGGLGGLGGLGGIGGQGGAGLCELPFDGGDCDAAIPVYFHNAATGRCEPTVYGGCGGNDNRFETYADCENTCGVVPSGQACQVGNIIYPDGWRGIPDPVSCNTCLCRDGQLDECTDIDCSEPCEEGTIRATDCTSCGPTDACLVVRTGCLPACDEGDPCENGGLCNGGACRLLCG